LLPHTKAPTPLLPSPLESLSRTNLLQVAYTGHTPIPDLFF
jgi:hypothetical protein